MDFSSNAYDERSRRRERSRLSQAFAGVNSSANINEYLSSSAKI